VGDDAGIHVYGSASIGALRAAELHPFGMTGVGRIFAAYRDGILTDDDEVAVLHGPKELGYPPVTEAMVNIRATLEKAVSQSVLDSGLAARLLEIGKALFYKERGWEMIFRLATSRGLSQRSLDRLSAWLCDGRVDPKRADALEMIAAVRAQLAAGVTPLAVSYRFHDTGYHKAAQWQLTERQRTNATSSGRTNPTAIGG
jgi:hypothetical protein